MDNCGIGWNCSAVVVACCTVDQLEEALGRKEPWSVPVAVGSGQRACCPLAVPAACCRSATGRLKSEGVFGARRRSGGHTRVNGRTAMWTVSFTHAHEKGAGACTKLASATRTRMHHLACAVVAVCVYKQPCPKGHPHIQRQGPRCYMYVRMIGCLDGVVAEAWWVVAGHPAAATCQGW